MEYLVSDPSRIATFRYLDEARLRLIEEAAVFIHRTFVDTFDWSVYQAGATLEWHQTSAGATLIWNSLTENGDRLEQDAPEQPGFPADLPPGAIREQLIKIVAPRRLLPMMVIETSESTHRLLNEDDQILARLVLRRSRFKDPRSVAMGDLRTRLCLIPLPGHEEQGETVLNALSDELGLAHADTPLLFEALSAAGQQPADYSGKINHQLEPQGRADAATKEVLRTLFATLEANLEGTRTNLDSEFLHDLRVATRRIRSALGQIRRVFPDDLVAHFKGEFAWLQEVTGPVRDLDVYLLEFDSYQQALPPALRPNLEPLRTYLHSHYAERQGELVAALESDRFVRLCEDWRAFLADPLPVQTTAPNGSRPIKWVADRRIRALAKRVSREGRAIRPDSPPDDLHELRKSCKKLRYLMEFFQSLYPRDQIRPLIGHLKVLLDNLGDFQDRTVQAAHLRDLARAMLEEGQASSDTLLAIGAVVGRLLANQQQAREEFTLVFETFLSAEHQQGFRTLLAPAPKEGDETP